MSGWDISVDFVVVGSGGGGLTAAVVATDNGADTLVVEKGACYGGTTALSGGVIWIPNNHLMKEEGLQDSEAEGLAYLEQLTEGEVDSRRLQTYIQKGAEMVRYMEEKAGICFEAAPLYMDYYPELDGGKQGARSLDPVAFSRRKLGVAGYDQAIPTHGAVLNRFSMTAKESHKVLDFNWKTKLFFAWRMFLYYIDIPSRLKKLPDNRMTLGQALIGRLRKALLTRNIPLKLKTSATELIVEEGCVVGLKVVSEGKTQRIRAKKGVLLAAGGFAHNAEMRQKYQQQPIGNDWTAACENNTGDGIRMGIDIGADVEFMHCAWWTPTMKMPDGSVQALIIGKSMPGCFFVGKNGKRFTNEAAPYEDVVKGQYAANTDQWPTVPAYMVFDGRFRRSYPCGPIGPSTVQPDHLIPQAYKDSHFLKKGETIAELAAVTGIDEAGLAETIERINQFAQTGKDLDFGRGNSIQDRYYSDPTISPNPTLAPLTEAPYYAIEIFPGDLGTKGGLKCNEHAQVLDQQGEPIKGLYATGNCSGSVMGNSYPGAGSTIGPSMTFGYVAALHASKS